MKDKLSKTAAIYKKRLSVDVEIQSKAELVIER